MPQKKRLPAAAEAHHQKEPLPSHRVGERRPRVGPVRRTVGGQQFTDEELLTTNPDQRLRGALNAQMASQFTDAANPMVSPLNPAKGTLADMAKQLLSDMFQGAPGKGKTFNEMLRAQDIPQVGSIIATPKTGYVQRLFPRTPGQYIGMVTGQEGRLRRMNVEPSLTLDDVVKELSDVVAEPALRDVPSTSLPPPPIDMDALRRIAGVSESGADPAYLKKVLDATMGDLHKVAQEPKFPIGPMGPHQSGKRFSQQALGEVEDARLFHGLKGRTPDEVNERLIQLLADLFSGRK